MVAAVDVRSTACKLSAVLSQSVGLIGPQGRSPFAKKSALNVLYGVLCTLCRQCELNLAATSWGGVSGVVGAAAVCRVWGRP